MAGKMITDHALVRYLERVAKLDVGCARDRVPARNGRAPSDHDILRWLQDNGIDVEGVRVSLATPKVVVAVMSGAKGVVCNGYRYTIRNGRVTTVMEDRRFRKPLRIPMAKGCARAYREEQLAREPIDLESA